MRRYSLALVGVIGMALGAQAADRPDACGMAFEKDGTALFENALIRVAVAGQPSFDKGAVRQWLFKPTGHEMVDVLFGQTDYVEGHVLGERWDAVAATGLPGGAPEIGTLYAPIEQGVAADGSGAILVQESRDKYRFRRTITLRRDLAALEVRYELANESADRKAFGLRLHTAWSPGARGKYQRKDDTIFLATDKGVVALDQALNNDQFQQKFGADMFFRPGWETEPRREWTAPGRVNATLTGNWAAQVSRANGDGLYVVIGKDALLGFYNCPGTTLEPVLRPTTLARGESWSAMAYVGSFSGASGRQVADANPLFVVCKALEFANGRLSGEVLPAFLGKLRVLDGGGRVAAEYPATPTQAVVIASAVGGPGWTLEAADRTGLTIGSVTAAGEVALRPVTARTEAPKPPRFSGEVYRPEESRGAIAAFLKGDGGTVVCPWSATDEEKTQARALARTLGWGLAWQSPVAPNAGGRQLLIGSARDSVVNDIGRLKHSLSAEWPGAGRGAILYYDNVELTQEPMVVIAGSDPAGAVKAAAQFADMFLKEVQAPAGFAFWASRPDRKIYPHSRRLPGDPEKIVVHMAKGEYEPAQVVLTAFDELKDVTVSNTPVVNAATGKELVRKYGSPRRAVNGPLWVRWVGYAPTDRPEGWAGDPDPLFEQPERGIPAGASQSLWLTFIMPEGADAGVYTSSISARSGDTTLTIPIEIHVWDFVLPNDGLKGEPYINFNTFPPGDSRELKDVHIRALVGNMVEHGMRVFHLNGQDMFRWHFSPEGTYKGSGFDWLEASADGTFAVDTSRFDWMIEQCDLAAKPYAIDYTLALFEILDKGGRAEFRKAFPNRFNSLPAREGHYYQDYYAEEMLKLLKQHLDRKGLTPRLVVKISDEPRGVKWWYDSFTLAARNAGLPIMTCFNSIDWAEAEPYIKDVAVWQPLYMHYNAEFFAKARAAGAKISWYNCGPPPRIVTDSMSELRGYVWQTAKADLERVAWWGIQCWGSEGSGTGNDLWRNRYAHWNQVVFPEHPTKQPWMKPGKGWVDKAPLDGIRWEMIREGMEDAWYVNLLRTEIAAARKDGRAGAAQAAQAELDKIWIDVFPTLNDYKPPYAVILGCREKIAEQILALQKAVKPEGQ